jgi:C1A family cysteine protease
MKRYGWRRDQPDGRDLYVRSAPSGARFPVRSNMLSLMPPVYDQESLGSCTAQAAAALLQSTEIERGAKPLVPARLQIYWCTRDLQGTVAEDSGATLRDTIKSVHKFGYCYEDLVPYKIANFKRPPSRQAMKVAQKKRVISYARVPQLLNALKEQLIRKNPIIFGFSVYESFEGKDVAKTGIVPLPERGESMLGGHAVALIGYDDEKGGFLVRNSWGKTWGDQGNCWMPYAFILSPDLAADFWTITAVP